MRERQAQQAMRGLDTHRFKRARRIKISPTCVDVVGGQIVGNILAGTVCQHADRGRAFGGIVRADQA